MNAASLRIYLVDAHVLCREGLRHLLQQQPHITVVGESGEACSCLAQIQAAAPDIVLLDVEWHPAASLALCQQLTTAFPPLKVITLSTASDLTTVTQMLEAGAAGYVLKNAAMKELLQAIAMVKEQRTYLSAEIVALVVGDYLKIVAEKNTTAPTAAMRVQLTQREHLLLKLVAEGRRSKEIATALGIRVKSAETYRSRLMKKLGCTSTTGLVHFAIREGIVAA